MPAKHGSERYAGSMLEQRRDGLLREAEYLQKRIRKIHEEVTAINLQIAPRWPKG